MENIKKYIPYGVIVLLFIVFSFYIPTIKKGQQLNKLQELSNVWKDCETKQLQAQTEAKQLREQLGLSNGTLVANQTGVVRTGTQAQQLTGSIIE